MPMRAWGQFVGWVHEGLSFFFFFQCYSSILFRRLQENPRLEEKRVEDEGLFWYRNAGQYSGFQPQHKPLRMP